MRYSRNSRRPSNLPSPRLRRAIRLRVGVEEPLRSSDRTDLLTRQHPSLRHGMLDPPSQPRTRNRRLARTLKSWHNPGRNRNNNKARCRSAAGILPYLFWRRGPERGWIRFSPPLQEGPTASLVIGTRISAVWNETDVRTLGNIHLSCSCSF